MVKIAGSKNVSMVLMIDYKLNHKTLARTVDYNADLHHTAHCATIKAYLPESK